jgi:hypothetical protein
MKLSLVSECEMLSTNFKNRLHPFTVLGCCILTLLPSDGSEIELDIVDIQTSNFIQLNR